MMAVATGEKNIYMRTSKGQVCLRIRLVSPEPLLFIHRISEPRESFGQRLRATGPMRNP